MTIRFMESFDGVATIAQLAGAAANDATTKWLSGSTPATYFSLTAGKLKYIGVANQTQYIGRSLPFTFGTGQPGVVGLKYTPASISGSAAILDLDTIIGNGNLQLRRNGSNLELLDANTQRAISAGTGLIAGTEYAIELKATFVSGTNWTVVVRVNGTVALTATNQNFGSATFTKMSILGDNIAGVTQTNDQIDAVYVDDADFAIGAGTWKIQAVPPDGNGAHSDFVNSAGNSTNNYSYVDEQSRDDSDYVQGTNDGDEDTYAHAATTHYPSHTVLALQIVTHAAYLSSAKKLAHVMRQSGGTEAQSADITLTNALSDFTTVRTTMPDASALTFAGIDAAEFGFVQHA